jgi:hypothetical protein
MTPSFHHGPLRHQGRLLLLFVNVTQYQDQNEHPQTDVYNPCCNPFCVRKIKETKSEFSGLVWERVAA